MRLIFNEQLIKAPGFAMFFARLLNPIHFVSGTGSAYASVYSMGLTGTVLTRHAQLEAFRDGRGLALAGVAENWHIAPTLAQTRTSNS